MGVGSDRVDTRRKGSWGSRDGERMLRSRLSLAR